MNTVKIATVAGATELEAELADRLGRAREIEIYMRCLDRAEVLAVIKAAAVDLVLLVGAVPWFDEQCREEAARSRVRLAGIARDPFDVDEFTRTGIDFLTDATTADLLRVASGPSPELPEQRPVSAGKLVAVWGPKGAPGRTTLAIEIAHAIAERDASTLLVDGDPYGGDVKQLLGITEEVATVIWAAAAAGKGELTEEALKKELRRAGPSGPVVLPGLPRGDLWPDVSDRGWNELLGTCRSHFSMTLVDTGPFLGEESPLPGRDRDRITRKTLEMSDKVVMVVRGDPVGIKHLFWSLEGLSGSVPSERCILVVNRSLSGGDGEILSAIRSRVGMAAKVVVPFVPADTAYALDRGRSLHECRPSSPVVEAARLVADSLFADRRVRGVLARLGGKAS